MCPSYHDFWESPDGGPDVDDGGEEAGDEEHDRESGPGLPSANLHLAGIDNDPVPVHGDGHHQQWWHEHSYAGERLDKPEVEMNQANFGYFDSDWYFRFNLIWYCFILLWSY